MSRAVFDRGLRPLLGQEAVNHPRRERIAAANAIEAAVIYLIVQGIRENHWSLRYPEDMASPVVRAYLDQQRGYVTRYEVEKMLEANPRQATPE